MILDDKNKVYVAYFGVLFFTLILIDLYNKYVKKSEGLQIENDVIQIENLILRSKLDKFSDKKAEDE